MGKGDTRRMGDNTEYEGNREGSTEEEKQRMRDRVAVVGGPRRRR
jgi:hypothetical protein